MKKVLLTFAIATIFSCAKDEATTSPAAAEITEFSFRGITPVATGTISGEEINITVPEATDVTNLVATFSYTGASIKVGEMLQTSGTTPNDFTNPVNYVVTSQDGTVTKEYKVTVSKQTQSSKEITAFSFKDFPDAVAVISETNISITLPEGTTVTGLVANFSHNGASVKIGSTPQTSGTTPNDFTNPVKYLVTALDNSTKEYTITVTVLSTVPKLILPFSYEVSFSTAGQLHIYPKYSQAPDEGQTFAAYQSEETCTATTLPTCAGTALTNNGTIGSSDFYATYTAAINSSLSFYLSNTFGGETKWQKITINRFSGRCYVGNVVLFKGKLWVIGGLASSGYKNDVWSSSDGITWTQVTTTGTQFSARYGHQVVVFGGKLWVIGGSDGSNKNDIWSSSDGISWTQVTTTGTLFSARLGHQSVAFDGKLWVIGGDDGSNKNDVWSSSDGESWVQETADAGFSARSDHQVVVFGDKLWVIGGFDGSLKNDVWSSSDGIDWTEETAGAGFSGLDGHQALAFGDKLWVIGGNDGSGLKNDVWSSSDGIDWDQETAGTVFSPRSYHQAVVFNNNLWVIGGVVGYGEYRNDIWSSANGASWSEARPTVTPVLVE